MAEENYTTQYWNRMYAAQVQALKCKFDDLNTADKNKILESLDDIIKSISNVKSDETIKVSQRDETFTNLGLLPPYGDTSFYTSEDIEKLAEKYDANHSSDRRVFSFLTRLSERKVALDLLLDPSKLGFLPVSKQEYTDYFRLLSCFDVEDIRRTRSQFGPECTVFEVFKVLRYQLDDQKDKDV